MNVKELEENTTGDSTRHRSQHKYKIGVKKGEVVSSLGFFSTFNIGKKEKRSRPTRSSRSSADKNHSSSFLSLLKYDYTNKQRVTLFLVERRRKKKEESEL